MATQEILSLSTKFLVWFAALLATAFFAWAGVVWNGWQDVRDLLFEVKATQARIIEREVAVENQLQRLRLELDEALKEIRQHRHQ